LKIPDSIFESPGQDRLVKLEPILKANRSVDPCRSESVVSVRNMNRGRSSNKWNGRRFLFGDVFDIVFVILSINENEESDRADRKGDDDDDDQVHGWRVGMER
jgi:hypothetical protein